MGCLSFLPVNTGTKDEIKAENKPIILFLIG